MIAFPNAKINIGLYVTEKRADGYHNIETLFYPVEKNDALEIIPAMDGITSLFISGMEVSGSKEDNLIWKAYMLLKNDFPDKVMPLTIYLHKVIPMGGGLGGGSSDAAYMLTLLNDFFDLNLSQTNLLEYALRLGSDCPFFIINKPCFATGRGEVLQPVALDLSAYEIKIITPPIHCSTALAFKSIVSKVTPYNLEKIAELPVVEWKNIVFNDFEKPLFMQHPELEKIKNDLYDEGALYASLSGSGASLYGIFKK